MREAASRFPEFELSAKRARSEPRGLLKFQWHPHPELWCYIAFRPLDSEAFDALIGWSTRDRFPIADGPAGDAPQDLEDFDATHAIDWSLSFVPRAGTAHWDFWNPPEGTLDDPMAFATAYASHFERKLTAAEAEQLVRPAVSIGMAEVEDFGLPYLKRRAAYALTKQR